MIIYIVNSYYVMVTGMTSHAFLAALLTGLLASWISLSVLLIYLYAVFALSKTLTTGSLFSSSYIYSAVICLALKSLTYIYFKLVP